MMTQLWRSLKAKQANRKKMINNEAKTTVEENKAVHNKCETGRASHCENGNDNQLAIRHDLGRVAV